MPWFLVVDLFIVVPYEWYLILDGVGLVYKKEVLHYIFGFVGHLKSGNFKKRENDDQS